MNSLIHRSKVHSVASKLRGASSRLPSLSPRSCQLDPEHSMCAPHLSASKDKERLASDCLCKELVE